MADYTEGIGNAIREGFCTVAPAVAVGALIFGGIATLGVADVVAGVAAGAIGLHAYNRYCNEPLPEDGRPSTPFTGGQCPVVYNMTVFCTCDVTFSGTTEPRDATRNFNITGPIGAPQLVLSENQRSYTLVVPGANGSTFTSLVFNAAPFNGTVSNGTTEVTSLTRVDGLPDDCGNTSPVIPVLPPGGNIVDSPVTYTTNNNVNITIPMVIAFGYAQVNFNGTVEIPLTLNFTANPELNLSGTINLNTGDTNFYPDPGAPSNGCDDSPNDYLPDPSVPDYPDSLPGVDPATPAEPDMPERRKILRGVVVTVTSEGNSSGFISQGSNPDIWFPDLGFVQFAVQVGDSIAWLRHEKVNSLRHLIQCNWPSGAIEVRGTPRPGVTWILTPVFTTQSFVPQYPPE